MNQTSVAVIGAGYWGRNLVRVYAELGCLSWICDSSAEILAECRRQHPSVSCSRDYRAALADVNLQAVVLAVPAECHAVQARDALLADKDVFVEKPLALTVEDALELKQLAEERGLILMVGHLLQYHPAFVRLKELVREGELGRIRYIYSNRLSFGKIRREEDIMWSFAPHDISMILALTNEAPESIMATGGNYLHEHIADVTTTHMDFASGIRAHVFVSWLHPFKEQKLVVVGDRNMAVFQDTEPWGRKLLLYPHNINWHDGVPVPDKHEAEAVEVEQVEPLRAECEHFLESVRSRHQPVTDADEGLAVLRVLRAGQESLLAGGRRVSLNAEPRRPYFVHESSYVDEGVEIGGGTRIWHFSHVIKGSRIGSNCNIGQNVVIGPDAVIGNGCKIQNNVSVYKGVTLEDNVFCGPSMVFTNVYNPRAEIARMEELRPTLVREGASIGANVTIVCGVTIGRYAFIGAGAVVNKDVPDHALMVGNPARQIGWMCKCGVKCRDSNCSICGCQFEVSCD